MQGAQDMSVCRLQVPRPWERCGTGPCSYQPGWQRHCPQAKSPWKLHLGELNSCCCKRRDIAERAQLPSRSFQAPDNRSRSKVLPSRPSSALGQCAQLDAGSSDSLLGQDEPPLKQQ